MIIHAKSQAQAGQVLEAVRQRLKECRLELHPEKTKIVYCQDDDRKGQHEHIKFDFLGYTFRPRRAKNRRGKFFVSFLPAISNKAAKAVRETIRDWRLAATRNNQSLEDIARLVNPSVRGWVNYYGRFYRSALTPVLRVRVHSGRSFPESPAKRPDACRARMDAGGGGIAAGQLRTMSAQLGFPSPRDDANERQGLRRGAPAALRAG